MNAGAYLPYYLPVAAVHQMSVADAVEHERSQRSLYERRRRSHVRR